MSFSSFPGTAGRSPDEFWQDLHEAARASVRTVSVNTRLAEVAVELPPGTALDLGCGQGGDTLWLARRGWHVTAVDIAVAALDRVTAQADVEGLTDLVRTERHDLAQSLPTGRYDLVSAQYLQTPYPFARERILHDAAGLVRPGGLLLVVDHGSIAPWSWFHDTRIPAPAETLDGIGLPDTEWQTLICEARRRVASGPGGQIAEVADNVIALRRRT